MDAVEVQRGREARKIGEGRDVVWVFFGFGDNNAGWDRWDDESILRTGDSCSRDDRLNVYTRTWPSH